MRITPCYRRKYVGLRVDRGCQHSNCALVGALEHANTRGQTRLATYLEAVVEEVVFEVEADTRRGGPM